MFGNCHEFRISCFRMTATSNLNCKARCLVMLTVPIVIISAASIIIGILSIWKSAPFYKPPYCIGGAMISGVASLISAGCCVKFYRTYMAHRQEGLEIPTYETWSKVFFFVWGFVMMASMLGLITGIWGMLRAKQAIESTETPPIDSPMTRAQYGRQNQDYAIATFAFTFVLCILMATAYCTQKCFDFDFKSNRRDYYDTYFRGSFIHTVGRGITGRREHETTSPTLTITASNLSARDVHPMTLTDGTHGDYTIRSTNERTNGGILSFNITRNHGVSNTVALPLEMNPSRDSHNVSYISDDTLPPPRYATVCSALPPSYEEIQKDIARDVALGSRVQLSGIKTSYL